MKSLENQNLDCYSHSLLNAALVEVATDLESEGAQPLCDCWMKQGAVPSCFTIIFVVAIVQRTDHRLCRCPGRDKGLLPNFRYDFSVMNVLSPKIFFSGKFLVTLRCRCVADGTP